MFGDKDPAGIEIVGEVRGEINIEAVAALDPDPDRGPAELLIVDERGYPANLEQAQANPAWSLLEAAEAGATAVWPAFWVRSWTQQTLADSAATIECLSAGLHGVAEELWAVATAGDPPAVGLRARWWSLLFYVLDTARHAVSDLYRSSGSAVYGTTNPVERSMRDIHAVATTFEQPNAQAFRADAGRVLAGNDPIRPGF